MAKKYGQKTERSMQVSCAYECVSWAELQPEAELNLQLEALGWHNPGGGRWHCPECCAADCVLFFQKTGIYHDGKDSGVHLECLGVKGSRRFQSISRGLLGEKDYRKLINGERVALKIIKETDLLESIAG